MSFIYSFFIFLQYLHKSKITKWACLLTLEEIPPAFEWCLTHLAGCAWMHSIHMLEELLQALKSLDALCATVVHLKTINKNWLALNYFTKLFHLDTCVHTSAYFEIFGYFFD